MSYSDKHAPPSVPLGDDLPAGLRRSLLDVLTGLGPSKTEAWDMLRTHFGWGDWKDAGQDFIGRYGSTGAQTYCDTFHAVAQERGSKRFVPPHRAESEPALLAVPTPFFLTALELIVADLRDRARSGTGLYYKPDPRRHVNDVFARRGVAYRMNDRDQIEWVGDEETYRLVVAPARSVLRDSRLAGARSEFEDALSKLRADTPKDREDAIDEAAKAVESAMKVLLDEHAIPRPTPKETAEPLWQALRDGGVIPKPTKNAVLAPSQLRNVLSGHGTGPTPRVIPEDTPELAVHAASAALIYLAGRLP